MKDDTARKRNPKRDIPAQENPTPKRLTAKGMEIIDRQVGPLGSSQRTGFENMAKLIGWDDLTLEEQIELHGLAEQYGELPNPIRVNVDRADNGSLVVSFPGTGCSENLQSLRLKKAFHTKTGKAVDARLRELLVYLESSGQLGDGLNAGLNFVESMDPKDQAQAMLLVQAYATHDAAMSALAKIGRGGSVEQVKMFGNLAAKLLRTYQGQMETLTRMQRGNEQVIKHVYVDNRGGQAVIAENVTTGGAPAKGGQQPHAASAVGECAALLGSDPLGNGVPISGDPRQEEMQDARWSVAGSTNGSGERELSARQA